MSRALKGKDLKSDFSISFAIIVNMTGINTMYKNKLNKKYFAFCTKGLLFLNPKIFILCDIFI